MLKTGNKITIRKSYHRMDKSTENRILHYFREGQSHLALTEIVRYLGDDIYGLAMHYTHNAEDAGDIVQDVFLKIWKKFHTFKKESTLKSWALQITRNTCLSYLTSRHYRISREDGDYNVNSEDCSGAGSLPDLRSSVETLPLEMRTPLILYHFMACSYEEIARILDLPLNTVKARIRRGRLILAKHLKAKGYQNAV